MSQQALSGAVTESLRTIPPKRARLFDYYRQQPVPEGESVRGRPNNVLRLPFPRCITEVHTRFFLGVPPTLSCANPQDSKAYAALSRSGEAEFVGKNLHHGALGLRCAGG